MAAPERYRFTVTHEEQVARYEVAVDSFLTDYRATDKHHLSSSLPLCRVSTVEEYRG